MKTTTTPSVGKSLVFKAKKAHRFAYKTTHRDPIFIPVNRISTPYQTGQATNPDKVRENVRKIRKGEPMAPVVIGYNYDLHDGHHRVEAAKQAGHTHVPCVVGGIDPRRVAAAEKRYRKVWKSESKVMVLKSKLSAELKEKVSSGAAHWVTITDENSPLHGRHLLIGGPRPPKGEKSHGEILAGHGIPRHLIEKITGKTRAEHFEHEQSEGPQQKQTPERFKKIQDGENNPFTGSKIPEEPKSDGPFSQRDVESHNAMTHFPTTLEKMNNEHNLAVAADRRDALASLKRHGIDEIPENVENALQKLAEARKDAKLRTIRARNTAPPWSVTGRSGYKGNHEKAHRIEAKGWEQMDEAKKRLQSAISSATSQRISSDDDDAVSKLQKKIEEAEHQQALFKQINTIVRSKKHSDDQKVENLMSKCGLKESTARDLLKPDFAGRVGIPSYSMTNNNANIKRMKDRVAQLEKLKTNKPAGNIEFPDGIIHDNQDANRVQIFFDGRPSQDMRDKLKGKGFRWSPSAEGPNGEKGAWQRMRSGAHVLDIAKDIVGAKDATPEPQEEPGKIVHGKSAAGLANWSPAVHHKVDSIESKIRENPLESGHVVDMNGNELWSAGGTENQVNLQDDAEKGVLQGSVFTHNHPGGSSFSPEDISVFLAHGIREMRAVGKQYSYRMQRENPEDTKRLGSFERSGLNEQVQIESQRTREHLTPLVQSGKMTAEEASIEHWHHVWSKIAPHYGLKYERVPRT